MNAGEDIPHPRTSRPSLSISKHIRGGLVRLHFMCPGLTRRAAAALGASVLTIFATVTASPAHAAAGSNSVILNYETGMCVDVPNYGAPSANAPVTQYTCNTTSADNQLWYFHPLGTTGPDRWGQIRNAKGNYCLDLPGYGSVPEGTHVYVYPCNSNPNADNQIWWLVPYSNGWDYIVSDRDSLCLNVSAWANGSSSGSDWGNDKALTVYHCHQNGWANYGTDDHLWHFSATL